ncbi:hypothetical protein HALLA_20000 (plasmid) [Halostagnicola larsenii XH-48]|uniref:DUF8149 domain-containing protein n=1 Tax=Halostagnicola larsenii XH-48 TaxID=797299 RepID=W0JYA8_9EURY|nr:hypothetical protein [Halostagnicola larsenii]AHG02185.1 hypothetical protein HALLA_20000 [Halostagnicola larsenii XH-48]
MAQDSDDGPSVPIVCDQCETTARVPLPELAETLEGHNDRLHDGEERAVVDPAVADSLADLIADDLGLLDGA